MASISERARSGDCSDPTRCGKYGFRVCGPCSQFQDEIESLESGLAHQRSMKLEAQRERNRLDAALEAICHTNDSGPWMEIYREAGGGYEGLQAIAREALNPGGSDEITS